MNELIEVLALLLLVPAFCIAALFLGLLFRGIDRKLAAKMQARVGPPIRQPFIDLKKLLMKENIVPETAVGWVFNSMPAIALAASLLLIMYIPFGGMLPLLEGYGDLILVLYLLMIPALALAIGGFSSGSPYANVGAQREMVLMMSYEFALSIVIVSIAWLVSVSGIALNPFLLSTLAVVPVWSLVSGIGAIGLLLLLLALMLVMPASLGRIPADIAEAKTEIADGILTEYSGRNLALFYLAQDVRTIAFSALVVALFLPWNLSQLTALTGNFALLGNLAFFLVKIFIVMFFGSVFVHIAVARFKVNQAAKAYWGPIMLIALAGMALVMWGAG